LKSFRFDTCGCKIEVNDNFNWAGTIHTCRLHMNLRGQNLLDTCIAQSRRFNLAFGNSPTENQFKIIYEAKIVNELRIRKDVDLSNFDEHLPFEEPLTFFQNLKRLLRLAP